MQVLICPICGGKRLFIDPEDESKEGCIDCSKFGKHYKEVIPLATPQDDGIFRTTMTNMSGEEVPVVAYKS